MCFEDTVVLGKIWDAFLSTECSNIHAYLHKLHGPLQTWMATMSFVGSNCLTPIGPCTFQFFHVVFDLALVLLQILHQAHECSTLQWLLQLFPYLRSLEHNLTIQLVQKKLELWDPLAVQHRLGLCISFQSIIHGSHGKGIHELLLLSDETCCGQLALQVLQVKLETAANLLHRKNGCFISSLSNTRRQCNPTVEDAVNDQVLGLCSTGHVLVPPLRFTVGLVAQSEAFASDGCMGKRATRHTVGGSNLGQLGPLVFVPVAATWKQLTAIILTLMCFSALQLFSTAMCFSALRGAFQHCDALFGTATCFSAPYCQQTMML